MANKSNAPRLGEKTLGQKVKDFIGNNSVPIMFILICLYCIPTSGFSASYLLNEVMTRLGRNAFLILSLLIPIMAGMGLNFGMTLGAMAGEIGLIFVADWQIWGIPGPGAGRHHLHPHFHRPGCVHRQDPEQGQGP